MRSRTASWLAWSLGGLSAAMFIAGVVFALMALYVTAPSARLPSDWGASSGFGELLLFLPFLVFPVVGALITSRRTRNPIGWICLTEGLFWMLIVMSDQATAYSLARTGSVPGPVMLDAVTQAVWVPPVGLLGTFLILLFPDGRLPSRRWRPLAWLSAAVILLVSVAIDLSPGRLPQRGGISNPLAIEGHPWVPYAEAAVILLLPLCILASASSLIVRYRYSDGEVRQQIKWLAFAASFVGVLYLITLLSGFLLSPGSMFSEGATPVWLSLGQYLLLVSYAGIPAAIGIAILKYRLYDIDLIINRTLVYTALTAMLVLTYLGTVVLLQWAFRFLSGGESQLAVVASTLLIAALFNPLRRRVQALVDRRFYRRKYDAAKILEAFSARLRDETDVGVLSDDLVGVVRETVQPEHASLWLKPPQEKILSKKLP